MSNSKVASKVSSAAELGRKNAANEAKRLEEKVKAYNASMKSNSQNGQTVNSSLNSPENLNTQNNKNSAAKEKMKKNVATTAAQAVGVPKEVADPLYDYLQTEQGQKMMKRMNKTQFGPLLGNLMNKMMYGKNENKQTQESVEPESAENFKISKETKKKIILASIPVLTFMVFFCLFISASQTMLSVYSLGSADEASSSDIDKKISNTNDEDKNTEISDDDVAYSITIEKKEYATPYFLIKGWTEQEREHNEADLRQLEDFFGGSLKYDETSNMNTVHNFYFKLHDIYVRYSMELNVELDLPLLMSTLMIQSKDMNKVFISNTKESYDRSNIDSAPTHELDYSHDWSGYRIIANDSSHDIEILAQNMVSPNENGTYELDYEKYDEFLKEFLEKKYYIEGGGIYNGKPELSNGGTCTASFSKYELTDEQLRQIASLAYHEQGTAKGAAAEASLMANLFELKGSKFGEGAEGLYNYVRTSGWFANSAEFMDSKDASEEIVTAVKTVLVEGKRTIPAYIDEHDMLGDITSVKLEGKSFSVDDKNSFVAFKTKLKNKYGAKYTFYSFPDTNSDPFGYTSEEIRKSKGEFYYDFETGEPQNCEINSAGGTDLSSAFVSLAVNQLNDPSKDGGKKYWRYMGFSSRVAWCASFVSWNIYNAEFNGTKLSDIVSHKSAAVDSFMNYFHNNKNKDINFYYNDSCSTYKGKNGKNKTYIPKEGDLIFFDNNSSWNGSFPVSRSNLPNRHVGIVQYVKNGKVVTIEGNSGDKVKENKFDLSSCRIIGFGSWY